MTEYTPCGGCGATEPLQRCIGCFHDFGGSDGSLSAPTSDAREKALRDALEIAEDEAKSIADGDGEIYIARRIADRILALIPTGGSHD